MSKHTNTPVRPLPLSALALLLAFAAGAIDFAAAGWTLFAAGAALWMMVDGAAVVRLLKQRNHAEPMILYSTPPALTLLAYLTLAGGGADVLIGAALAVHALVVWALLMGASYAVSEKTALSHRI